MNWYLFLVVILVIAPSCSCGSSLVLVTQLLLQKNEQGFDIQGFRYINDTCDAYKKLSFPEKLFYFIYPQSGLEIATHWSPMRPKIEQWQLMIFSELVASW